MEQGSHPRFEPGLIGHVDATEEVDIETTSSLGKQVRATIWILTDGREVYVRSLKGADGRWYHNLVARPDGAVHIQGRRIPIRAVVANDASTIALVSDLFRSKYGHYRASTEAMLQPHTLEATLRLDPA
jgi:hypothetical protein